MGFGVWGLGFGVWGLGFWVWGMGVRVEGLGVRDLYSSEFENNNFTGICSGSEAGSY